MMKKLGFVGYRPGAPELRAAIDRLIAHGIAETDILIGADIRECWPALSPGDKVVIGELTEVCTDIVSLLALLAEMEERNVLLESISEPWLDMSQGPQARAGLLKGLNRFGWDSLSLGMHVRGTESLKVRKRGRPRGISGERLRKSQTGMLLYRHSDLSVAAICDMIGLEQRTFYRYLNANKEVPRRRRVDQA